MKVRWQVKAVPPGLAAEAFGSRIIRWWCPGCDLVHQVPIEGPHAWGFSEDPEGRPTLTPSIAFSGFKSDDPVYPGQPKCHGFLRAGRYEFCGDCEHALAGQTVDLPEFEP